MGCGIKDQNNDICGETFTCGACVCANQRDVHLSALNARNVELSAVKNDRDDLAKRVWGLNDQVERLKDLLTQARGRLPGFGVLAREIESELTRVE